MKTLISALMFSLMSVSAFAAAPQSSVQELLQTLSPANKAKADRNQIYRIVRADKSLRKIAKRKVGVSQQALVDSNSCTGGLYVQQVNLASQTTGSGCETKTSQYIANANVAVDMDFRTFSYDLTTVHVQLYAEHKTTKEVDLLIEDVYTIESDAYGSGANTVVYLVGGDFAYNYNIFADVYLDDELGTACLIETNYDVIQ